MYWKRQYDMVVRLRMNKVRPLSTKPSRYRSIGKNGITINKGNEFILYINLNEDVYKEYDYFDFIF